MGVREEIPYRDAVVDRLYQGTLVSPQDNSGVVRVVMYLPNRQGAALILNTLLDLYQDFRLEALDDQGAVDFFRNRTGEIRDQLREVDDAIATLETDGNVHAFDAQVQMLLVRINDARERVNEARILWREADHRLERLREELDREQPRLAGIGVWPEGSIFGDLLRQITEIERELERRRLTELPGSPLMDNLRAQRQVLVESLQASVEAREVEARRELAEREGVLEELTGRLEALGLQRARLAALERQRTASERSYLSFQEKLEEAEVNQALALEQLDNVAIIEWAMDPVQPAGPRKVLLIQVLLALSLFGALSWVAVAEFFDQRVHSREDLERGLGVPVLASIPIRQELASLEAVDATGS